MNLSTWGIGRILAVVGVILTVVFIVIGQLALMPVGLLFALAFCAMLF